MSSIPLAAFSAPAIHEVIRKQRQQRQRDGQNKKFGNTNKMEEPSQKTQFGEMYNYNLKFMNSVWGLYNRYAPQAFQKNEEFISAGR